MKASAALSLSKDKVGESEGKATLPNLLLRPPPLVCLPTVPTVYPMSIVAHYSTKILSDTTLFHRPVSVSVLSPHPSPPSSVLGRKRHR